MHMNVNHGIYDSYYTADHLRLKPDTAYDQRMIALRFSYIQQYGIGKDVLDLCCGTGLYLIPVLGQIKSAVGVDFSSNMLDGFRSNLQGATPKNLQLVEADATALPLQDSSVDFVFSYTSLYHVPNVRDAIREVWRVLRHGGYAVLEMGNRYSLATFVSMVCHREHGWAKPFHVSYWEIHHFLRDAKLDVVDWHAFQILPMFGALRRLFYLYPFLTPFWKHVLGIQVGGRMLDDWLSSSWPLRYFAFRHVFVVTKQ